ncbi:MAG TPA: enolase C-terminal domain-like protein [Chthoniobacteraceae bacterium]|nr:enolase C-terminal domain-like protein [Chthoniobacteraceae bacterium]
MQSPEIIAIEAWEVVVPVRRDFFFRGKVGSGQGGWDRQPIVLLELQSADGLTALAEVPRGATLARLAPELPCLLGAPAGLASGAMLPAPLRPVSFYGLQTLLPPARWENPSPLAVAYEQAQYHFTALRAGVRLADLFGGGAMREMVPVDYWCGPQSVDDLVRLAIHAGELGFRGIKTKMTLEDDPVRAVAGIAEALGPDFGVTIDAVFQFLDFAHCGRRLGEVARLGTNVRIEDPFPQQRPDEWRRLREAFPLPLVWHARDAACLNAALEQGNVADQFNLTGRSLSEFFCMAAALELRGGSAWHGSGIELGVGQLYRLHAAAAMRCAVLPGDLVGPLVREHSLSTAPWNYHEGHLPLPDAAGLGAELDPEAVRRYQRDHLKLPA